MNIEEQRAHYAAIKNRIAGRVPILPKPQMARPILPVQECTLEKERRHVVMLANGMPNTSPELKASLVCLLQAYNVFWTEVIGKGRSRRISNCRRAITWLLHLRGWSFPRIGEFLHCDHSSCVYAVDKANSWGRVPRKRQKKSTFDWSRDPIPVPKLRGNLTATIESILQYNNTTWTHLMAKVESSEVILARRHIILFLHQKEWRPIKISQLVKISDSNVSRCIKKYGNAS
jgi:hypothetical protein